MNSEEEYKELFLAEAHESHEELNKLFTVLEKDVAGKSVIDAIFRITHTLKGNAMGMGFTQIAELSHVLEDIFGAAKQGALTIDAELFQMLFNGVDKLGQLINSIQSGERVNYKGIKTKLEVTLKNRKGTVETVQDVRGEETVPETDTAMLNLAVEHLEEEPEEEENEESDFQIKLNDVVQVPVRKLDSLLNIVGELIIEKDSLTSKFAGLAGNRGSDLARLHRITSDLQYGVMDVRLIQVGFLFNKFHRIVRDVASIEGKQVNLVLEGTEIEIDRNVIKVMSDSLVHLVRNAVSHGIESPDERVKAGKPVTGTIWLKASNEKDTVFIEVKDDGGGIDGARIKQKAIEKGLLHREHEALISETDAINFIFEPGFSNADTITAVSGRGVGMDVVKRATESIGGKIDVTTTVGQGSKFVLSLPSSMAVKSALLFELDAQEYAIPLNYTEAVVSLRRSEMHLVNTGLVANYLDKTISVVFLRDLFADSGKGLSSYTGAASDNDKCEVIIVSHGGKLVGFVVDKLLQQKEIVEKTLSEPVAQLELISGATILGNGNVCLVLDIANILRKLFKEKLNLQRL